MERLDGAWFPSQDELRIELFYLIREHGVAQATLARLAGLKPQTVCQFLRGKHGVSYDAGRALLNAALKIVRILRENT